jgi:adenosylcobinamide kinase/adenosylcobinamide-phosphate guanylyltransferase
MGKLIFITGGARSGKSNYAEKLAKESEKRVTYLATAIAFDDGMKDRIKKHQQSRPQEWTTIERYSNFKEIADVPDFINSEIFLFDCLTVMITNLMMDSGIDFDTCDMDAVNRLEEEIKKEVEGLIDVFREKDLIMVSNEVGLGLVPFYKFGNYFRDISGRMNQLCAEKADEVYFCVSGIPTKIK